MMVSYVLIFAAVLLPGATAFAPPRRPLPSLRQTQQQHQQQQWWWWSSSSSMGRYLPSSSTCPSPPLHRRRVSPPFSSSSSSTEKKNPEIEEAENEENEELQRGYRSLNLEFVKIGVPSLVQFTASPLAALVDAVYLGRLGPVALGGAGTVSARIEEEEAGEREVEQEREID